MLILARMGIGPWAGMLGPCPMAGSVGGRGGGAEADVRVSAWAGHAPYRTKADIHERSTARTPRPGRQSPLHAGVSGGGRTLPGAGDGGSAAAAVRMLALRLDEAIPAPVADRGFEFGHTLFGTTTFVVLHFVFAFPGFQTYNVLINSNNLVVQAVLRTMLDDGDYFFFALQPQGQVTAFRAELGSDSLAVLRANRIRLQTSTTTDAQYQQALTSFAAHPAPAGILLPWVCRETVAALDLTTDRMTLTPA